jgi:hypothetical protein
VRCLVTCGRIRAAGAAQRAAFACPLGEAFDDGLDAMPKPRAGHACERRDNDSGEIGCIPSSRRGGHRAHTESTREAPQVRHRGLHSTRFVPCWAPSLETWRSLMAPWAAFMSPVESRRAFLIFLRIPSSGVALSRRGAFALILKRFRPKLLCIPRRLFSD